MRGIQSGCGETDGRESRGGTVTRRWIVLPVALALGIALASPASSAPGSGALYGTDGGSLFTINQATGEGTLVGPMIPTPTFGFTSLAADSAGTMYAVGGYPGSFLGVNAWLFTVDAATGQATALGELSVGEDYARGDFFGMDSFGSALFGAQNRDYWPGADRLVAVDPAAVAAGEVGTFGRCTGGPTDPERQQCSIQGMDALAFDAAGTLYGAIGSPHQWWPDWLHGSPVLAGAPGLYKISPTVGAASCDTWPLPYCSFHRSIVDESGAPPAGGVASLQFACDGTLYGGTGDGRLLTIDPLSGRFSYVGSTSATGGSPLLDLAFQRSSCPAPPPDTSPPVINVSLSGTVGENGWYLSDVTLSRQISDSESGIVSTDGCEARTISLDGAWPLACHAVNGVGLERTLEVTVRRDATPPKLDCRPAQLLLHQPDATVSASVADATSGPQQALVSAPAGVSQVGTGTVILTGSDLAGNSTTVTCEYSVSYRLVPLYDPSRPTKRLDLALQDANGSNMAARDIPIMVVEVDGIVLDVRARHRFRLVRGGNVYRYRLRTLHLTPGLHLMRVRAGADPILHSLTFIAR